MSKSALKLKHFEIFDLKIADFCENTNLEIFYVFFLTILKENSFLN